MPTPVQYDSESRRRWKSRWFYLLIGLVVFVLLVLPVAALIVLWGTTSRNHMGERSRVAVPNVVGRECRSGELLLKEQGLVMQIRATRPNVNAQAGKIVD